MSAETDADRRLTSAKEHVREAIKDLGEIVVNQCYGHDGYEDEYAVELAAILQELVDIRRRLR